MASRAIFFAVALFAVGCVSSTHGRTLDGHPDSPFVAVEAGTIRLSMGHYTSAYIVDRATRTCWIRLYESHLPLRCCDARRVPALAEVITWESDATCAAAPSPPPPAPSVESAPARRGPALPVRGEGRGETMAP